MLLLYIYQQQKLRFCNGYHLLTVIIANIIDSGNFNVRIEQMFTTLTIISLVQATVIVIQKYGHCVRDFEASSGCIP